MNIIKYPDPRLTAKNEKIGVYTREVAAKVHDMREAMAASHGIGLAAPQIGWNVRLFVMSIDNPDTGENEETIVFDPEIEIIGEKIKLKEGCLSLPFVFGTIERSSRVRLKGKTPHGEIDQVLDGLAAHAAQHEMDHLDGILMIDRMTPADLKMAYPMIKALEDEWEK